MNPILDYSRTVFPATFVSGEHPSVAKGQAGSASHRCGDTWRFCFSAPDPTNPGRNGSIFLDVHRTEIAVVPPTRRVVK